MNHSEAQRYMPHICPGGGCAVCRWLQPRAAEPMPVLVVKQDEGEVVPPLRARDYLQRQRQTGDR